MANEKQMKTKSEHNKKCSQGRAGAGERGEVKQLSREVSAIDRKCKMHLDANVARSNQTKPNQKNIAINKFARSAAKCWKHCKASGVAQKSAREVNIFVDNC